MMLTKLVNALRVKKLEKSHDPLALVVHTGSSSRTTTPYYVTHPSSVVDYDDDYQGYVVQNNFEDPLTSVMILLSHAITQCFSNLTNNHLRTSSNTKNKEIVQGDRVNIQSKISGNDGRNIRRSYVQEEIIEVRKDEAGVIITDEQNNFLFADALRMGEIEELSVNICLMARIQPANFDSDEGPSYDYAFLNEVQTSTSYVNPLFAKDTQEQKYPKQPKIINNTIGDDQIDSNIIFDEPNRDVNSGSVEYDNNVQDSYALEQLARNAYKEAEKQQIIARKVQQQNTSILKRKISENEDKYHDTVLDLEARAKKNEDVMLKMGNSLQGMFMLGPKPMSFYDSKVKHGLGYTNPYTLKKAISQNLKLYDASCLDDSKNQVNVRDTEGILDDATKSQIKMKKKSQVPIAMEKKQKVQTIDYKKLNALYEDFIPQKEFSGEQKYFSSSFISSENSSNASSPYSSSETKPTVTPMSSANPMLVDLNKMENVFKSLFELLQMNSKRESIFYTSPEEIRRTQTQTQGEINELIENVKQKTYAYADVRAQNQDLLITISELKAKLENVEKISPNKQQAVETNKNVITPGMYKVEKTQNKNTNKAKSVLSSTGLRATSSVRIPSNRDSLFKNSVLSNTKNSSEKVEVSDRSNKKSDVALKDVDSNKKIVTNADIKNALIAKNVLCVICAKNVLIPCHDDCLAKYKLNVHSKVRRALFTTSRIVKSKFKDPTSVVSKTRFSVKTVQSKFLDTTPVVSKTEIAAVTPLCAKNKVVQIVMWIVDSGCSKQMTGDRSLLKKFVEKFMGTVHFGNDHFVAITGYGDYVQGKSNNRLW
ncbi:hypothetical protein Tco_0583717 [Tanacetum coccineum]